MTLFLQAFIELLRSLPENEGQADDAIYLTDTLSIAAVESKFLFKVKPAGEAFRTYKFGYTVDNPSYEYMRYRILGEEGGGTVFETFYTLNLSNGKRYFKERLRACHNEEGISGLQGMYRTLTKRFLVNEYIIKDEFDVFVAFETMNKPRQEAVKSGVALESFDLPDDPLYRCGAGSCGAQRSP